MENNKNFRTLLIRMDKIGDLVVSLNAAEHPTLKESEILWVVSRGLKWVMQHSPYQDNFIEANTSFSFRTFFQLVKELKKTRANTAVVFQAPWFIGLALLLAGVPRRVGRLSQWHSYLFFNRGVRQKRSLSEKHESEYNWDLISDGLQKPAPISSFVYPTLSSPKNERVESLPPRDFCVVHPGMMGSALNWPVDNYQALIQELSKKLSVVITGTANDRAWTEPLRKTLKGLSNIIWLQEKLTPEQLLHVLAQARFVVAPSTGVIHLASALGTPVVGFYSPRLAERASRWGPLNKSALIFSPPANTFDQENCMALIQVQDVVAHIVNEYSL